MKLNKSIINFVWLVGSSVAIKGVGVVRESIIAAEVGNTMEFATFNTLRSLVDFFLAFVIGVPIIESMLVPKYAHEYMEDNTMSFQPIWNQTLMLTRYLFALALCLLFATSFFKTGDINVEMIIWVLLFSLYLALSLSNSVLFSLQKATGNFRRYSTQSLLNAIVVLFITFSLISFTGLKAVLLSVVLGIVFSNLLLKRSMHFNFKKDQPINKNHLLNLTDINFYKLISVNHAIFIGFTGRLLISLENDYQINFYQYSFIIISSFMLVIVSNISSIILYRSSTANTSGLLKTIIITFCIAIIANLFLYFLGKQVIHLLYQRGKFTEMDTVNTYNFLKIFLIPYTFFSITQVMIQPFLNKQNESIGTSQIIIKKVGQIIFFSFLLSVIVGVSQSNYKLSVLVLLYSSSILILLYLGFNLRESFRPKFN